MCVYIYIYEDQTSIKSFCFQIVCSRLYTTGGMWIWVSSQLPSIQSAPLDTKLHGPILSIGFYSIKYFPIRINYLRKLYTFTYLHQQNRSILSKLELFELKKNFSMGIQKIQSASWECSGTGTVWFRPPNQPGCNASIVNKTNFRNNSV